MVRTWCSGMFPEVHLEAVGPAGPLLRRAGPSDVDPALRSLPGSPQWQPERQGGRLVAGHATRGHHLLGQARSRCRATGSSGRASRGDEHALPEAGDPPGRAGRSAAGGASHPACGDVGEGERGGGRRPRVWGAHRATDSSESWPLPMARGRSVDGRTRSPSRPCRTPGRRRSPAVSPRPPRRSGQAHRARIGRSRSRSGPPCCDRASGERYRRPWRRSERSSHARSNWRPGSRGLERCSPCAVRATGLGACERPGRARSPRRPGRWAAPVRSAEVDRRGGVLVLLGGGRRADPDHDEHDHGGDRAAGRRRP